MKKMALALAITTALIAGPARAEEGSKTHSDHSTRASYVHTTGKPSGPDHAHMREQHRCQNMGFKLGTDAFSNCLLHEETNRTQRRAAEAHARAIRDAATIKVMATKDVSGQDN